MGWKQWSVVAVLIGGGILLQIPNHDDSEMDHTDMEQAQGSYKTVAIDVTGMT